LFATASIPELTTVRPATASRYLAIWALTLLLSWLVFAGFIAVVDPYDFLGSPRITGFNASKYEMSEFGRIAKLREVGRQKPQALILGDSQAEGGLRSSTLAELTGERAYNLGFLGARIEETKVAFGHALQVAPVRTAVLALDYVAFEGGVDRAKLLQARADHAPWRELRDFAEFTLSMKALVAAGRAVLFNHLNTPPSHDYEGDWVNHENIPINDNATPVENKPPADSAYAAFDKICALAREHHVDLRMFATPVHRSFGQDMASRAIWLRRLRAIAAQNGLKIADEGSDAAFNADKRNFFDRGHFVATAGDAMLKRLFANSDRAGGDKTR